MASKQQANPTGNGPAFRTRGLSLILACVLMINVLLVVVAPTLRPEQASAQDKEPTVAENVEASKEPKKVQSVETTTQTPPKEDSETSLSTNEVSAPRIAKAELQNQTAEMIAIEPPKVSEPELVSQQEQSVIAPPTKVDRSASKSEAVAHSIAKSGDVIDVPKAAVQPEAEKPVPVVLPKLLVVNPAETGGTVFYLVDGEVHSLAPGETLTLEEGRNHKIEFHRGEGFGDAEVMLSTGIYHFQVDSNGWNLTLADASRQDK